MAPVASIVIFGVLSYVSGAPVLEDDSSKDDPLWDGDRPAPAAATLDASYCRRRADGPYPHPGSTLHYYRCSGGESQVVRCEEGSVFVSGRCEAPAEWRPCVLQPDGLHPNVSDGCASYYRCGNGSVVSRLRCPSEASGRLSFSARLQRCVPAVETTCALASCPPAAATTDMFFVTPGTACRHYHRCRAGLRADFRCPAGFVFHWATQVCVTAGESLEAGCAEPVCVGRVNGRYADAGQGCARWFRCEGGALKQVAPCPQGQLFHAGRCRPAHQVSCPAPPPPAPAPGGECWGLQDGAHALPAAGCRDYVRCAAGRTLARRSCPDSTLFDGRMCVPAPLVTCREVGELGSRTAAAAAGWDACSRLGDGFHADYSTRGCRGYVLCAARRTLLWGACSEDAAWDRATASCLPLSEAEADGFLCEGPSPWPGCKGKQPGFYADPDSCTRYYHCSADGNRTQLSCRRGQVFDGRDCVPEERGCERPAPAPPASPSLPGVPPTPGSCQGAADGYYRDPDLGCRSYYYCSHGHKITYVCSGSYVFDGKECVDPETYKCPYRSDDCVGLSDGYHFDADSGCRKYFFCLGGYKITALTCDGDRVFDGRRCVDPSTFRCPDGGAPPADSVAGPSCAARSDGMYPDVGAGCRRYFICRAQRLVSASTCPGDKLFNGRDCVSADSYTCGSVEVPSSRSPECDSNLNGFFQNVTSGCRTYYFCIDGTKTVLKCPGNEVFNGQLCVDAKLYTCPTPREAEVRTTCVK